jgi:hypothetical protein
MKVLKIIGLLFIVSWLFISCSQKKKDKKSDTIQQIYPTYKSTGYLSFTNEIDTSLNTDANFRFDFIYPIPKCVLYGGGSFTYDSVANSPEKYIFLSNLSSDTALISLNGKMYLLSYDSLKSIPRENDSIKVNWKGNSLYVTLKLKVTKETGDEITCEGVLEVMSKKAHKKLKIHGSYED